jgi:hypothetical protein
MSNVYYVRTPSEGLRGKLEDIPVLPHEHKGISLLKSKTSLIFAGVK